MKKKKEIDTTVLDEQGKKTLAMLTALEDESQLNDWEIGFVANVADWFYGGSKLTPRQYETLEKVYRKFN